MSHELTERTAQLIAHRVCCGTEHDPANGKLHGYCVVCGVDWPCEYAGKPPASDVPLPEFLALLMCSDPWPVQNDGGLNAIITWADRLSRDAGFSDWIDAYHKLPSPKAQP